MRYTLRQLEVFVAVARGESVTGACAALALSQSAASAALATLEGQFDAPLFDRLGKRLHLNERGRALLPAAVELLDRAAELEARMAGHAGYGPLHIGATLTIGNYLAAPLMAAFLQQHPEARVLLEVHNTAAIVDRVVHQRLDLGLVEGVVRHPELESEVWLEDDLVVFAAPGHPLSNEVAVTPQQLATLPWILREPGSGTRETFDHAMRHAPLELDVRLELEHTEAIKRAVEAGLGVGCLSQLALRDAFRRGSLVPLATPGLDLHRRFLFIWHRHKYHGASLSAFLALCRLWTQGVRRSDEVPLPPVV